nr:fimbrial assembly protein FimA [Actinomycetota bacterium]
ALLVVQRDGGYAGLSDSLVDLRVDDHEEPIEELRRLFVLHDQLFGTTPRDRWLPVDDALRAEIDERLATLGYERLEDWAGAANLEERVDGQDEIDPVVLSELRRRL